MQPASKRVAELLEKKISQIAVVKMTEFIAQLARVLKMSDDQSAEAFADILEDPQAFDVHYFSLVGLRILAEQGKLSGSKAAQQARVLLEATISIALQMGTDEWWVSIDAVSHTSETAVALLEFTEHRLLGKRDIREWRWLAFTAVGTVMGQTSVVIPQSLKNKLKYEVSLESDVMRKQQMQVLIDMLP